MTLFNLRTKKENKIKLELIQQVHDVEQIVSNNRLFAISSILNKIVDMLDNQSLKLDSTQNNKIRNELDIIKKYSTKQYEELLKNKCDLIIAIIRNDKRNLEVNNISNDNQERIYRIIGEQSEITEQIDLLTNKMNDALGKDKCLWQLYNMQRNSLYNRMSVIAKNYSTILSAQSNFELANEVKKAKEEAEVILKQTSLLDTEEFIDDANYITQVNEGVYDSSAKLNEAFAMNFGSNNDNSYENALEEKLLNDTKKESIIKRECEA